MKIILIWTIVTWAAMAGLPPILPIVDVKFGQRTIAVSDPNKRTLTVIGGVGELWICTSTSAGKTCKSGEDVINWITRNGDVQ